MYEIDVLLRCRGGKSMKRKCRRGWGEGLNQCIKDLSEKVK